MGYSHNCQQINIGRELAFHIYNTNHALHLLLTKQQSEAIIWLRVMHAE